MPYVIPKIVRERRPVGRYTVEIEAPQMPGGFEILEYRGLPELYPAGLRDWHTELSLDEVAGMVAMWGSEGMELWAVGSNPDDGNAPRIKCQYDFNRAGWGEWFVVEAAVECAAATN